MSARANGLGRGFTESRGLFALHGNKHVLECTSMRWVHIEFTPVSTSWAALEPALKVLQQARWVGGESGQEPFSVTLPHHSGDALRRLRARLTFRLVSG